jgi:hypothetical protein
VLHKRILPISFLLLTLILIGPWPGNTAENGGGFVVNRQVEGKFRLLTDDIFPTVKPHLSGALSFEDYYQWKRKLSVDNGLDFLLVNAPIYQFGSNNSESFLDNEMDFFVQKRFLEESNWAGQLFFWGVYVQTFSELPSGQFADSQNLISFPNGGATDPDQSVVAISALWWEQQLASKKISYRVGQLYAPALWGTNKYLGDDRYSFMNTVLSTNQGVPWAGGSRGVGATATYQSDWISMSAGFQDAKGDQKNIDFSSFSDGKFMYLGEMSFDPHIYEQGAGSYKFTVGYNDATGSGTGVSERDGWGITLSGRQDFPDNFGLFAIYRRSWEREVNGAKATAGAGVVFTEPFGWSNDWLGVGYFYADPSNAQYQDEHGVEAYWRMQLTHRLELTPDVQVYLTPAKDTEDDISVVFGLRLRYLL